MLFYIDVTAPVNVQVIITGKCKMEHANFFEEYICIIIFFFKGGGIKTTYLKCAETECLENNRLPRSVLYTRVTV